VHPRTGCLADDPSHRIADAGRRASAMFAAVFRCERPKLAVAFRLEQQKRCSREAGSVPSTLPCRAGSAPGVCS